MTSSLNFEYDTKVFNYLEALDKKYKCLICNGFLTCARIIECGHAFCAYCLDILESTKSTCPVCDHSIRPAVPAPQIDREVEEMLQYCSGDLYAAYQKAKASRIEKQKERSKTLKELADNIHAKEDKTNPSKPYKRARNMEEVCSRLAENVANRPITDIIPDCMINPNRANEESKQQQKKTPSKPKSKTGLQSGRSIPKVQVGNEDSFGNFNTVLLLETSSGLDIPRVEALFEMYDNLLLSPPDSGGSGDAEDESYSLNEENIPTASQAVETEDMKAARHKIQQEIELLVRDTEEAVDLYEFVHKWTDQIRDVALGGKQKQIEEEVKRKFNTEKGLVPMEWMDSQLALPDVEDGLPQTLDDVAAEELWKTSLSLIKRFRELENKGSLGCQQISNPSRLSTDPDWDNVELDLSIDNVSKAIKTQFDEEYTQLLEGDRLRESRHMKEGPSTSRSDEFHINFVEDVTEDGIEFFHKILRCKSALKDLKDKSKSATDPQHIRSLLPVQEFKEPSKSKSQTSVSVEPKHWKSELWIPEIEESNFQHYTKMLQSRCVAYPPPETYGSQSGSTVVCVSKHSNLKSLSTPRTGRSHQLSFPSPRPQRSNSGRLSGRLSPATSKKSSFK